MPTQEIPHKQDVLTEETLTIQEMARRSGLSEHTLRYYERIGLLTPVPRDGSSGHRRYSADMAEVIESLSYLRGTGMPLEDIRVYLHLRRQGNLVAAEQKSLFESHLAAVTEELEQTKIRMKYLAGKVAYWAAVEAGDLEEAEKVRQATCLLMPKLKRGTEEKRQGKAGLSQEHHAASGANGHRPRWSAATRWRRRPAARTRCKIWCSAMATAFCP